MSFRTTTIALATALAAAAAPAIAQDFDRVVKARQGQFSLNAIHIGTLGAMAKGDIPYDADKAQTAADNLVAISRIDQAFLWPEGSDDGSIEGTRALPVIWENTDDFLSKWQDFGAAAVEMQKVAANGRAALGPALGGLGDSCKACHEEYRAEE